MRRIAPLVVVLLIWVGWAVLTMPPRATVLRLPAAAGASAVATGAYHVHSRASDGTGSLPEIAAAAARAGLRFVIVTDHGTGFRWPPPPRYIDGVLCLQAAEISTTDGHYAVLGMAPPPFPLGGEARDVVEDVARLGGFGVAAHPDSAKRELRWDAWETAFDALEWFNADSQWRDEPRWRLLPTLLQYPARPVEAVVSLFDRPTNLLRRWDALTRLRHVVGLAAADAHARMGFRGKAEPYDERVYVKAPSYEAIFRAFSLRLELRHPLIGDAAADAEAVLGALRAGHVYTAFDGIAGPPWLSFAADSGGTTARQGDDLPLRGRVRIRAASNGPPGSSTVLIRNGEVLAAVPGSTLEWDDQRSGAYRIEVQAPRAPGDPPLPWIVTNPIYVAIPPRPAPEEPPPATDRAVLPAGAWDIEKDPASIGSVDAIDTGGAVRQVFRFQLGRAGRSPFVALATSDVGPLREAAGLAFRAGSTRPLRLSVQIRIVTGGSERRWQRSVYLGPDPRDITVAFSDMRVAGTAEREQFQPAQIQALLLVFDTTNARPGDGGVAWIERLRMER